MFVLANKITPTFHIQFAFIRKDFSLHLKLKSRNKFKIDEKVGNNAFDPNFTFSQFHPFQSSFKVFQLILKFYINFTYMYQAKRGLATNLKVIGSLFFSQKSVCLSYTITNDISLDQ